MKARYQYAELVDEYDKALRAGRHDDARLINQRMQTLRDALTDQERSVMDVYADAKEEYRNK
jgi:hypothetical protein